MFYEFLAVFKKTTVTVKNDWAYFFVDIKPASFIKPICFY